MKFLYSVIILIYFFTVYSKDFPIDKIQAGMKGIGKTVIYGTAIEEFDVEILGVLKNSKMNDSLVVNGNSILVRVSGDIIDKSGGIAAGMSGSPVYIDGCLVGAISSGWVMTDHTVGLVTPIEDMKKLLSYPKSFPEVGCWDGQIRLHGLEYRGVCIDSDLPGYARFNTARTPLIVSGLSSRSQKRLAEKYDVQAINMSGVQETPGILQEGSAVSVELARGDVNISSIGTLTWRDNSNILAFGHSFLKKGNVNYFFSEAYIYHCFSSINMPFKIGVPAKLCGMIVQDREQGIYGVLHKFPLVIPVTVSVTDEDLGVSQEIRVQVVNNNDVFAEISDTIFVQSVDSVLNRVGSGTASTLLSIEYETDDYKQYTLSRENIFYCADDIANSVAGEFNSIIGEMLTNDFEQIRIKSVTGSVVLTRQRKTAVLTDVLIDRKNLVPSEVLSIILKVKPYRMQETEQKLAITLPSVMKFGNCRMVVRAGVSETEDKPDKKYRKNEMSFERFMDKLVKRDKSNEISIAFFYDDTGTLPFIEEKVVLPYVVEGYFDYDFSVSQQSGKVSK